MECSGVVPRRARRGRWVGAFFVAVSTTLIVAAFIAWPTLVQPVSAATATVASLVTATVAVRSNRNPQRRGLDNEKHAHA